MKHLSIDEIAIYKGEPHYIVPHLFPDGNSVVPIMAAAIAKANLEAE